MVFYFAGAVLGGVFASSRFGFAGALWVAACVKAGIMMAWVVWRERGEDGGE